MADVSRQPSAPAWSGPPKDVLPGAVDVAVELLIARNERAAVYIGCCGAYPTGFEFVLCVLATQQGLDPSLNGPYARRGDQGNNYAEMLRFGIEFSDGSRGTNVSYQTPTDTPPTAPYLRGIGGRGNATSWSQGFWVWPLPPPGPLAFVCEWPAADMAHSRTEIDGTAVIEAGARATVIAPDQPKPQHSWSASVIPLYTQRR
jgi:hypothetical protein